MGVRVELAVAGSGIAVGTAALLLVPAQVSGESLAAIGNIHSPAFFPVIVALALIAISAAHGILALRARRAATADAVPVEAPLRLGAALALLVAYGVLIEVIGMVTASVLFVVALGVVLGSRNWPVLAALALALPLAIYALFERVLFVLLPHGILF